MAPVKPAISSRRFRHAGAEGMWLSPKVTVLLTTNEATSGGPVAWVSPFPKARVVTIRLGHGREAHRHPSYRRLLRAAVIYTERIWQRNGES